MLENNANERIWAFFFAKFQKNNISTMEIYDNDIIFKANDEALCNKLS